MIIFNKKYFFSTILSSLFVFLFFNACGKRAPGYNPYLHSGSIKKEQRANKKAIEKGTKNYSKQQRKTRRNIYGTRKPPVSRPSK